MTQLTKEHLLSRIEELNKQRQFLLQEEKEKEGLVLKFERDNKLLYFGKDGKGYLGAHGTWKSNRIQLEIFKAFLDKNFKVFTLTGANQISKTFTTFILILTCMRGRFPWEDESKTGWIWDILGWKPPIKVRWVGQDWEKHIKTVLEAKIQELLPKSWGFEPKKNNLGIKAFWTDPITGSSLELMSNNQEARLFEGWTGHLVAYDEPPSRDNRVACARGLMHANGREVFAMTLLSEAWVDIEVINGTLDDGTFDPTIWNINSDISVNIGFGITQEGVTQFAKSLNADERKARLDGVASYKSGLILSIDRKEHLKKRFEVPTHWMVDVAIDIGVAKPHDLTFIATDERNFKYIVFEYVVQGDGTAIGECIVKAMHRYQLRINRVICDPLAKGDKNNENSVWEKIDIVLNRHNLKLEPGSKDKSDGIIALNNLLWTVNGMPALFFFSDCVRCIKQSLNWMYDQEGKPSKVDDDQCENLYRLGLLDTRYYDPEENSNSYDNARLSSKDKNRVTGY